MMGFKQSKEDKRRSGEKWGCSKCLVATYYHVNYARQKLKKMKCHQCKSRENTKFESVYIDVFH